MRIQTQSKSIMTNIAIFVDVQNVYYTTRQHFHRNFDYNAFWRRVTENNNVVAAFAYATHRGDNKQAEFQNILRAIGFEVKLKPFIQRADGSAKADWDVGIAIDVLEHVDKVDKVILVSGDGDFDLLAQTIIEKKGKQIDVYGVKALTAGTLMKAASKFEPIEAELLL